MKVVINIHVISTHYYRKQYYITFMKKKLYIIKLQKTSKSIHNLYKFVEIFSFVLSTFLRTYIIF